MRQLGVLGEDLENPRIEVRIEEKLRRWVLTSVYEAREKDPTWNVKKLQAHSGVLVRRQHQSVEMWNNPNRRPLIERSVANYVNCQR